MLVLSRRIGDKILIGNNIVVTVTDIGYDRVRLGIEAPREIPIHRKESIRDGTYQGTTAAKESGTHTPDPGGP